MATTYLGTLVGGRINQYANSANQVYYHDTVAGTTSYAISNGFQDGARDGVELVATAKPLEAVRCQGYVIRVS
jgi:hypothetical protein